MGKRGKAIICVSVILVLAGLITGRYLYKKDMGENLAYLLDNASYANKLYLDNNLDIQYADLNGFVAKNYKEYNKFTFTMDDSLNSSAEEGEIICYPSAGTQRIIDRMNDYLDNSIEDRTITIDEVTYDGIDNKVTVDDVINKPDIVKEILSILHERDDGGYDEVIGH